MMRNLTIAAILVAVALPGVWLADASSGKEKKPAQAAQAQPVAVEEVGTKPSPPRPRSIAPFVRKGIEWLIEAQHKDGGWGGGSHSAQNIRDPHKVPSDPATTSFTTLALIRAGHTPTSGSHQEAVRRAVKYLVEAVQEAPSEGPMITSISGTQPQTKLGKLVDTTMTTQCLARVLKDLPKKDELYKPVDVALDRCIKKLEDAQNKDGSWNLAGGWAPVLQSSSGQTALELAQVAGKQVDGMKLKNARKYQQGNVDRKTGKAMADAAAGVELYAFAGGQRANAADARAAQKIVEHAKREGKVARSAPVSEETLKKAGVDAPTAQALAQAEAQNDAQIKRLDDKNLLRGFGNNGGEEFVSFLLTSESMIIAGGDDWAKWNDKMHGLLKKVQNSDGSWSGHHCITSPVFCTAAVVQCLLADRDADILVAIADKATEQSTKKEEKK